MGRKGSYNYVTDVKYDGQGRSPTFNHCRLPHTILLTSYVVVMTGVLGRWHGRRSLAICQRIRKFGSRVTSDGMAGISGRGYDDIWSSSGWWMYQVGFNLIITLCRSLRSLCDTKLCHNAKYEDKDEKVI